MATAAAGISTSDTSNGRDSTVVVGAVVTVTAGDAGGAATSDNSLCGVKVEEGETIDTGMFGVDNGGWYG